MNLNLTDAEFGLISDALIDGALVARGHAVMFAPLSDDDSVRRHAEYKAKELAMLACHSRLHYLKSCGGQVA